MIFTSAISSFTLRSLRFSEIRFLLVLFIFSYAPLQAEYYLDILVSARHLDYSGMLPLCVSMSRPSELGPGIVGHSWIHLHGDEYDLEGGHTGELGQRQPRYLDGVMDLVEGGDPNPVRYLWETLHDGYFQQGCGGHKPTFGARFALTKERFEKIRRFVDPQTHDYSCYALTGDQCASLVAQVAVLAGIELENKVSVPINRNVSFRGRRMCLWNDPTYSRITFASPDVIERSLKQAVRDGKAQRLFL